MPNSTPYSIAHLRPKSKQKPHISVFSAECTAEEKRPGAFYSEALWFLFVLRFAVTMQQLHERCRQLAAAQQTDRTEQQQLPDEPERRLHQHEHRLYGEQ